MTNDDLERLLVDVAATYKEQMFVFRARMDNCLPISLIVSQDGKCSVLGIQSMHDRIAILHAAMKTWQGVGFALVYDGYLTSCDSTTRCTHCGGSGCDHCRYGFPITARSEAINTLVLTKWGFKKWIAYPYDAVVVKGDRKLTRHAPEPMATDEGPSWDEYDRVWSE